MSTVIVNIVSTQEIGLTTQENALPLQQKYGKNDTIDMT